MEVIKAAYKIKNDNLKVLINNTFGTMDTIDLYIEVGVAPRMSRSYLVCIDKDNMPMNACIIVAKNDKAAVELYDAVFKVNNGRIMHTFNENPSTMMVEEFPTPMKIIV